jgi:hypothetical protein
LGERRGRRIPVCSKGEEGWKVEKLSLSLCLSPTGSLGVGGSEEEKRRRENLDQSRE